MNKEYKNLKAIIATGGMGTRFLPATKVIPKEILPIVDKPIIQVLSEELVESGVTDIILVTRKGGQSIENHFDSNFELVFELEKLGKKDLLERVLETSKMANFINLRQKKFMPYGNATPLRIASELVKNDDIFFYLYGDDITMSEIPVCQQLLDVYQKNPDVAGVIAVKEIDRNLVSKYGIVKIIDGTKNVLEKIAEKPSIEDAPSNLVSFGRFLFTPKILPIIEKLKEGKNNELWLVDAVSILAKEEKILIHNIEGKWLTTGDPLNFLKANLEFAIKRKDIGDDLRDYIKKLLY